MSKQVKITIALGNDEMREPKHVAELLRRIADDMDSRVEVKDCRPTFRDLNGNKVATVTMIAGRRKRG